NTMNSMAAPTIVATAVSATGGMAVMTTQNNGPTTVGGQIKLTLFTAVDGVSTTGAKLSNLTKKGSTEYEGFAFNDLWLFIGHQISDVVSVEIEPEISASTGATPKIGSSIGTQLNAGSIGFSGFNKAYVRYDAPYGFEISGGIVK